jgi:glycosyltransferase involved in cell wall biosynthesis
VKGHYDLIHALRFLPAKLNFRCLIVGEGKQKKRLERLADRFHLGERVTFCGYRPDIPVVMAGSDVVLLPSYREPFGLTIVEAMLSRKAVIASSAGGIPEIVTHQQDGLLFEAGDVPALAKCIEALVGDDGLRLRLAREGYKTAVGRFLVSAQIEATEKRYVEILGGAP